MRIASVTMIGQFPDGIDLHVRNLLWALSEKDHSYIITKGSFIKKCNLHSNDRTTFIDFGECPDITRFVHYWKDFPRIVREYDIDPDWFLFTEQDIWFYEKIKADPLPDPKEIRSHLTPDDVYHAVMVDDQLYHSRLWEGSILFDGPLIKRAIDFGIDFSANPDWFIKKDQAHWDRLAGGKLSLGHYDRADTMDEFALYCALVEKTQMTFWPRAVHLQGPEVFQRYCPAAYDGVDEESLQVFAHQPNYLYFCVYAAAAVYFIAGNWKKEADWKRMQPQFRPEFKKLIGNANEWMKPDEYERLEKVVAGLQ
jgi:hypothetical protein